MRIPNRPPIPQRPLSLLEHLPNLLLAAHPRPPRPRILKLPPPGVERLGEVGDADRAVVVAGAEGADGARARARCVTRPGAEGRARVLGRGWGGARGGLAFVVGYAGYVGEGVVGFAQFAALAEVF